MYSVIRFTFKSNQVGLDKAVSVLKEHTTGDIQFDDGYPDRISIDVSTADSPLEQTNDVIVYLKRNRELFEMLSELLVQFELDLAIEPEDLAGKIAMDLPLQSELIGLLHELKVSFTMTIYNCDMSGD